MHTYEDIRKMQERILETLGRGVEENEYLKRLLLRHKYVEST